MPGSSCSPSEYTADEWDRLTRAQKIAEIQAEARADDNEVSEAWAAEALDRAEDFDRAVLRLRSQEIGGAPPT